MEPVQIDRKAGQYSWPDGIVLPSVTHILATVYPQISRYTSEEHLARGRIVHRATALVDGWNGAPGVNWSTVDPAFHGYVHGWERFKGESGLKPLRIERPVRSVRYGFCGTPDRVGWLPQKRGDVLTILDIKTSQAAEAWWALQLAAYMVADEATFGQRIQLRQSVILRPDGRYTLPPAWTSPSDWPMFLAFLYVYRFLSKKHHANHNV